MNSIKKRTFSFILAFMIAFCPLSYVDAVSEHRSATGFSLEGIGSVVDSGSCGEANGYGDFSDRVTWKLYDNGKLVICGNGAMADFECDGNYSNVPYAQYAFDEDYNISENRITSVVIEEGVTAIGSDSFKYFKNLADVTIAQSVIGIGEEAFFGCDSLTSVWIPGKVAKIGSRVFGGCDSLSGVNVSTDNKQYTSVNGVLYCADKTELLLCPVGYPETFCEIEDGTTIISAYAFDGCQNLASVAIPDSVKDIGNYAFCNCTGLVGISVPDTVEIIGVGAFSGCAGLEEMTIPQSVTSLSDAAFNHCSGLKNVTLGKGITQIGEYTFFGCQALENISLPDTLDGIGSFAFQNCRRLTRIRIPDNVNMIGDGAFSGCVGLITVSLPERLKTIGDSLFAGCESLTSITVPSGVTDIGWRAFEGCKALTSIVIPDGVKRIGWYAFSDCASLTGIILPGSLTSILPYAFRSCNQLKDVYFTGSQAQWTALSIADGNDSLENACVHFDYTLSHIHTYIAEEIVPADCITDGYTPYVCTECGDRYQDHVVKALGHSFDNYISNSDATCTSDGTKTAKCSRCNIQNTVQDTDSKLGHAFSGYVSNNDATCTSDGTKTAKCSRCNIQITVQETNTKLGHAFTKYVSNGDATCTSDGTKTAKCTRCNIQNTIQDAGSKLGHTFTKYVSNGDATCSSDGTKTAKCTRCNVRSTVTDIGSKLNHKQKNTLTKATTEKDGKIVTSCSSCGKTLKTVIVPKVSSVRLSQTVFIYNGKTQTPSVTVKDSKGKTLKNGSDYTVKYASGRKKTGKYAVKVILTGNYSGVKIFYFTILPGKTSKLTATQTASTIKLSWKAVTGADGYKITLYSAGNRVIRTVDKAETQHTFISLSNGTVYKVKVTAYKTIDGKKTVSSVNTFLTTATMPGTPTLKVSAGTKKATLKWNRQTGASGYIVYMSTARNGTYRKTATIKDGRSVSYTKTGLTKGETYYFKVQAYSTATGKTIYGSFSAVNSVKVK